MPFILSKVNSSMTEAQEKEFKTRLGQAISLIPGKSEACLLCGFESNCHLYLQGESDAPIAYITVSIFANERHIGNDALFAAISKAFYEVLGIAPDRIYIKYDDIGIWGVCGQAIDRGGFSMNASITLTVFTDPMMGLSYESQPILDALKEKYGSRLTIDYRMSVLVRDVSDFMTPEERALPPEIGIPRYNQRLAGIYKSEEPIGHLPMNMEGFHLFDTQHRSSCPLCLAYHAAKLAAPEKAEHFLINLRAATILQSRPTTHREAILEVVNETGIDEAAFIDYFLNGSAKAALEEDQSLAQRLGIHAFPAYLLSCQGRSWILPFITDINQFTRFMDRLLQQ